MEQLSNLYYKKQIYVNSNWGQPKSGCSRTAHAVPGIEWHNSWTGSEHSVPWPSTRWQAAMGGTCWKVMTEYFFKTCSSKQTASSIETASLCKQYISCIHPCIDYAVSAWVSCSEQTKDLICRLQRKAALIITGNFDCINTKGADLVKDLGW